MSIRKTFAALMGLALFKGSLGAVSHALLACSLLACLISGLIGCHLTTPSGDATLSVEADTSLLRHERVVIILKDLPGGPDTVFDGRLANLDTLQRLKAGKYDGRRVLIVIQGIQGGVLVYEETRDYDGGAEKVLVRVIPLDLTKPAGTHGLDIRPDNVRLFAGGGKLSLQALPEEDWEGKSLSWSTGDPAVATVSQAGELTPVGVGMTYVRAAFGDSARDASAVQVVRDPPVLDVGAPDTAVKTGDQAAFGVKVTQEYGVVESFAWDLDGDGKYEDSAAGKAGQIDFVTASRIFGSEGTVQIRFQARDGEGNVATAAKSVKVTSTVPRIEGLSADKSVVSIKDSIVFSAGAGVTGSTLKSYAWDFDGDGKEDATGELSGEEASVKGGFRYPADGIFKARLRVTDAAGTSVSATLAVTVKLDRPVADAGADTAVGAGATVKLKGKAQDSLGRIVSREWKVGDGAFAAVGENGETSFSAPTAPGTLLCVFRAVDDDGLAGQDTVKVTVNDAQAPSLTGFSPADTVISIKDSVAFSARADASGADLKSYGLDVDGDGTPEIRGDLSGREADIQVGRLFPIQGVFTVSLKVEDLGGKSVTAKAKVTVKYDAPSADAGKDTSVPAGGLIRLRGTAKDTLGTIKTYAWKIGSDAFKETSGPDTSFAAPASSAVLTCIFKVTDDDGLASSDTLVVTVGASATADLSALSLSQGALAPAFAPGTMAYSASVANGTSSLTVTPTAAIASSAIKVNGTAVASGAASDPVALTVGNNTVTVEVTAQDGATKKSYVVTVNRAGSGNADLSGLSLSTGTLSPAFAAGTTGYSATVANAVTGISVTASAAVAGSTLLVNGTATVSGTASGNLPLSVGPNVITVEVTAQDGVTRKTYTVSVSRTGASNADLSALALSAGTLSPAFAGGTIGYTASVPNATASLTVTPTVAGPGATVRVNGTVVASGAASGAVNLTVGNNVVNVEVTAQDAATKKTYVVTVARLPSADADLSALSLSAGTLSPAFAAATLLYNASVANGTASLTVTPTAAGPGAVIKVKGATVASGAASGAVALPIGTDTIPVEVTAQDGVTRKTYKVAVTRAASTDPSLTGLAPSAGSLSPAFAAATLAYTVSVPTGTATLRFTPTAANSGSTITVNGTATASGAASSDIGLRIGKNTVNVYVLAGDKATSRSYVVTVFRDAPASMIAGYAWVDDFAASHALTSYVYNPGGGAIQFTRSGVGDYSVTFTGLGTAGGTYGHVQATAYGSVGGYCSVAGWSGIADITASIRCYSSAGAALDTRFTTLVLFPRANSTGGNAYLWADQPSTASYTPTQDYAWNSSGGDVTVTRTGAGRYSVTAKALELSTEYGVPMVTSYGGGTTRCYVVNWITGGGDITTNVACNAPNGTATDSYFTFAIMQPASGLSYGTGTAWVSGASANLEGLYASNSGGGAISAVNSATGTYGVTFAGLGSQGGARLGAVNVATYNSSGVTCQVGSWGSTTDFSATVYCHNSAGTLVNSAFNIWITK